MGSLWPVFKRVHSKIDVLTLCIVSCCLVACQEYLFDKISVHCKENSWLPAFVGIVPTKAQVRPCSVHLQQRYLQQQ